MTMPSPDPRDPQPRGVPPALALTLALRWPVALVLAAGLVAAALLQALARPIRIQLVLDTPLPVAGQVDVGGIRSPLVVSSIEKPISTNPILTAPISATVKVADPIDLAPSLSVSVPELARGVGVRIDGPVEARVDGPVTARVAGPVEARVSGDVSADLRGTVEATVEGKVDTTITHPLAHERIRLGL